MVINVLISKSSNDGVWSENWEKINKRTGGILNLRDKLKEYHLENGLKDVDNNDRWEQKDLRKIYKLILEIRYLEKRGDATQKSNFENDANNHCQNLVGTVITDGVLDDEFKNYELGGKFWLGTYYLRLFAWDSSTQKLDANLAIKNIKEGKDDFLAGIELKDRFEIYLEDYQGMKNSGSFAPIDKEIAELIRKELKKDTEETAQSWTDKLKVIGGLSSISIDDNYKKEWTDLPKQKFDKIDKVKALIKEVLDSDNKVKSDFIEKIKTKKASLTDLAEVMKEKPRDIIALIESYKYDILDDSATNEKDKKKTQMKRRIAKSLNKAKESDLPDSDIPENLAKVRTGELEIEMSKYYTADLREITNKKPKEEEPNSGDKPFFRWDNPLPYIFGVLIVGAICTFIFWDKLVNLFSGDKEENN